MLKLTKKADYGLIAMKYLAERAEGQASSAKDIAEAQRDSVGAAGEDFTAAGPGETVEFAARHQWRVHAGARFANDFGF